MYETMRLVGHRQWRGRSALPPDLGEKEKSNKRPSMTVGVHHESVENFGLHVYTGPFLVLCVPFLIPF